MTLKMTEIIAAIISGFFVIVGVLLSHYLRGGRDRHRADLDRYAPYAPAARPPTSAHVRFKLPPDMVIRPADLDPSSLRAGQVMCGLAIALFVSMISYFDPANNPPADMPWWGSLVVFFGILLGIFGGFLWYESRAAASYLDRVAGQVLCGLTFVVAMIVAGVFDLNNTEPWWEKYFHGFCISLLAFGALLWAMSPKNRT
jgi:hypothetical protein